MPMSNYGRVINQTQVDQLTAAISGVVSKPGFNAADWCAPITHFGQVLQMISRGIPDKEITKAHQGWTGDVLKVCHKIVDGTLSEPNETPLTDEKLKQQEKAKKKREKARMVAYRRRYGKINTR